MDAITLTGASLVDRSASATTTNSCNDPAHNHGGASAGAASLSQDHSHSHNSHVSHVSHHHGNNRAPCCGAPVRGPQVRVVYTPPTDDELKEATPEAMRTSLETLIRLGGYKEAFEPLLTLILQARPDAHESVLNALGDDHYSLLHWAAKRTDDVRFLRLLCSKVRPETINIASSDKVAMRPLHWAATDGGLPHASTLLQYGANLEGTDSAGCTPLLIAAQYGHVDLVALLLQRGANGMAVDKNRDSALHWAAYKGSIQVCGHLLFRKELNWTTIDAYGQTPLHLAAIRGNTSVIRYLLQEGTHQEAKLVLHMPDKNGKTPLDLAITKQKPTVELVLREHMDLHRDKKWGKQTRSALTQLCSYHSWQIWLGCSRAQDVDVTPKFPLYFMLAHMVIFTLWYPFVFTPVFSTSDGVLWDYMGLHTLSLLGDVAFWYFHYKTRTTNPGILDETNPETAIYRKLYEQTIESFSTFSYEDDDNDGNNNNKNNNDAEIMANKMKNMSQLCHTCHIFRPLRSKHCRDARRCILLFDHQCPFVGNTIGLYNYKWFYMTLFFMTWCCVTFAITLSIYLQRRFSWVMCIFGLYLSAFILFGGGMLVYHTQLSLLNLTTNEHINVSRYNYLKGERGEYKNPFFRGWHNNFISRFHPSPSDYTLSRPLITAQQPQQDQQYEPLLMQHDHHRHHHATHGPDAV